MARPSSASNASRLATSTTLIPDAAICRANSLPIPDEAPVTSAQGPNRSLSTAALMFCSLLSNSRIDAAGCLDDLPRDPPSVGRGEERDHIGDIRRRSEPPQRRARNHSLQRLLTHPHRLLDSCVLQGPDPVFKPLCLHHHHLAVVGAERNSRHTP